jgi:uncharacterized protein YigE (DUF2233 family)
LNLIRVMPAKGRDMIEQIAKPIFGIFSTALVALASAGACHAACRDATIESARYIICEFTARDGIELFLRDDAGAPLGQFGRVRDALAMRGRTLVFAMNAGMYHEDRSPVGLYVENGRELKRLSTANGSGNFSMKPNGVFYIDNKGAGVLETKAFARRKIKATFASQSGPMLVIDGRLHPRFRANSTSRNRRNGVGVAGKRVVFALADDPVTFHQFARVFRDVLKTPNALYLDGSISRLYATDVNRDDFGFPLGPIVAVSVPATTKRK